MKTPDLLLLIGAAILGYAIAPKEVKEAVTPSGFGSFNITMPEIKMPTVNYPSIAYPAISYPAISFPSGDSQDLTGEIQEVIEQGRQEIQDLISEGKKSIEDTGIDVTSPSIGNPLTGGFDLIPKKLWGMEEASYGATWKGWGEMVTGWQVRQHAAYDISGLMGTRTLEILEGMGYEVVSGALPWQTEPGYGIEAPWKKILFDPDTGKVLTFLDIQNILKDG